MEDRLILGFAQYIYVLQVMGKQGASRHRICDNNAVIAHFPDDDINYINDEHL